MKILESYKKMANSLLLEIDDEKMIKYKDKDGESKEMKAGSAKTMPDDHPAKQAWQKMSDADKGGDDSEKDGGKLGGGDFDRDAFDASDEPDTGDIPSAGYDDDRDAGDEDASGDSQRLRGSCRAESSSAAAGQSVRRWSRPAARSRRRRTDPDIPGTGEAATGECGGPA